MNIKSVTIVGVGLIGGSIGLALREKKPSIEVIGFGRKLDRLKGAFKKGCISKYELDLQKSVEKSDLIIICTPVETIPYYINKILPLMKKFSIITDVGSVKYPIISKVRNNVFRYRKMEGINFIGSHPIAGSEKVGFEYSDKNLFKNSICVVCYNESMASKESFNKIKFFWNLIGAKVVELSANKHDEILSSTSHFLHILAYLIVYRVAKRGYTHFTAGAYRDMTRIAASDPELWSQICYLNRKNILSEIEYYIKIFEKVKKYINDENLLKTFFLNAYRLKLNI
ncbi:MAG: prephenate dehydrogenase [Endomicrobia bacterium]|nr:prephenate dehydrogenase [Endomicrobiia bacterium]